MCWECTGGDGGALEHEDEDCNDGTRGEKQQECAEDPPGELQRGDRLDNDDGVDEAAAAAAAAAAATAYACARLAGFSCSMEGVSPDADALDDDGARCFDVDENMFSSMTLLMR